MTKDSSGYLEAFAGFRASAAFSAAVPDGATSAFFDWAGALEFSVGGVEPGGVADC